MGYNHLVIAGSFRSGTTILTTTLAEHSQLLLANELWSYRKMSAVNAKIDRLREVYPKIGGSKSTIAKTTLGDNFEKFLAYHKLNPMTGVNDLYDKLSRFTDKTPKLVGDKLPEYLFDLGRLNSELSKPKVLICIRDGRDVLESQTKRFKLYTQLYGSPGNHWWAKETVEECIALKVNWLSFMEAWEKAKSTYDLDYHEVYFKNLVLDLESEVRKIAEFLDIEFIELIELFERNFKTDTYKVWKEALPGINAKLPQSWKDMLIKHGFDI